MELRDQILIDIRPEITSAKILPGTSDEEAFQNKTLRPIIKMQNDILLMAFQNYIGKHKDIYYEYSVEKKIKYIENAVLKDNKLRNSLKGMIIGQFTLDEYETYNLNTSSINRRMMDLVKERLKDQIQYFDDVIR